MPVTVLLYLAVIVEVPAETPTTLPLELTVAIDVEDELQITDDVKSFVEASEYIPVAASCVVPPIVILGLLGVTEIEPRV